MLAPGDCRLCDGALLSAAAYPVCQDCLHRLHDLRLPFSCEICSEPLPMESACAAGLAHQARNLCSACIEAPPNFARATAFGLYDDLRPAIRLMKFEGVPALARPLGTMLAKAILELRQDSPEALTLIPVPLFRGKRAFNQSTLLARSATHELRVLEREWNLTIRTDLLHRIRRTESQFLLSPAQRRDNLNGAFAAISSVAGLDVLLIDDVYTTGATARECTRVLLRAGAHSVRISTVARAGRHRSVRWEPVSPPISSQRSG